jgi:hypothetical protein
MVSDIKGGTRVVGVLEQGAEENIWTERYEVTRGSRLVLSVK